MALTDSERPARFPAKLSLADIQSRVNAWLTDGGDRSLAQRVAGNAFLIRAAGAALAYQGNRVKSSVTKD